MRVAAKLVGGPLEGQMFSIDSEQEEIVGMWDEEAIAGKYSKGSEIEMPVTESPDDPPFFTTSNPPEDCFEFTWSQG